LADTIIGNCNKFEQASRLEWLQTNHTGAFAMGTVSGMNTRRYHGLLIASLNPPADRYSIFPRVEETVDFSGEQMALATVQYPGVVTPEGYRLLEEFSAWPYPCWRYRKGALVVNKSLRLMDGEQTVVLAYSASRPCVMRIRLFVSFRDYHSLGAENSSLNRHITQAAGHLSIQPYQHLPPLHFHYGDARFQADGVWFKKHEYLRELERGMDFHEDLYSPGVLEFTLKPGEPVHLIATLENKLPDLTIAANTFPDAMARALDQFRVTRADGRSSLVAGYPWFTDWSRDILISLPALMACGFAASETRAILEFLLAERKQGILPNRFSDSHSTPEYNTVDASLWFFVAANAYVAATDDKEFVQKTLFPAAMDIISWHIRGTFYGIHVDHADRLLAAGEEGTQLTWMDAKVGDYVVTPRRGKPVEINALWFNALQISSHWAAMLGKSDIASQLASEAEEVSVSFANKFWNAERGCLYDVVTPEGPDASLRPNQLFALSLPYPLVDRAKAQSIIRVTRETLLTPAGLRTLEPGDPQYRPRYEGDVFSRDCAYHQGTVWPWLIGPFIDAYLYAFGNSAEAQAECRDIADSILKLMDGYCAGSIGEVYDGDAPHHPGGCPAQLWSVAQLALALQRLGN
jgi:predicted glycogen debranching enzyme